LVADIKLCNRSCENRYFMVNNENDTTMVGLVKYKIFIVSLNQISANITLTPR